MMRILLLLLLASCGQPQERGCNDFTAEYCNMRLENILMLESNISTASECQSLCFTRNRCLQFSYFSAPENRCVLFSKCAGPVNSCRGCVSGPPYPRISSCQPLPLKEEAANSPAKPSQPNQARKQPRCVGNCVPVPVCATCTSQSGDEEKEEEEEGEEARNDEEGGAGEDPYGEDRTFNKKEEKPNKAAPKEEEGEEEKDEEVNVDNGLLDEVLNNRNANNNPNNGNNKNGNNKNGGSNGNGNNNGNGSKQKPKNGENGGCPTCPSFNTGFYYCVMGGSNAQGPVSSITVMNVGTYPVPRSPLIAPFPPAMTRGSGQTFSTFTGSALYTCTPGYPSTGITPASTFGPFLTQTYVPGTCNNYDFTRRQWFSTGGKMNTVREGGSTVQIGSYIVTLGGVSPQGYPLPTVEVLDPRKAAAGWQPVPNWSFPGAARDQCSVVTRDPEKGPEIMVMGGEGTENSVMKMVLSTGQWFSLPPMLNPRRQHACTKVNMNGRPGVVVSGGAGPYFTNMTAVEFFDLNTGKWINLPDLARGRRGHTMTTIEGSLAVVGGAATRPQGDTEFLDDVEVFDGSRWKRASYRLDGARNGANIVKIPISTFTNYDG